MNTSFNILIALCFVNTYVLSFVQIPYQCTNILLEYLSYMSYVATSSVNTLTKWRLNKFMILYHKYNYNDDPLSLLGPPILVSLYK